MDYIYLEQLKGFTMDQWHSCSSMLDGPQYLAAAILFTILVLVLTVVCFISQDSKGPDHSASGPKEQDRSVSDSKEQRALELDMSLMEETKEATGGDPPMLAQDEPKPGLYAVFLGITEAFLEEGGVNHFTKKVLKKMLRLREAEDKSRPRLDGERVTVWSGTAWIVEVDENAPYNLSTPDGRPAVATNDKLGVLYIVCVMALIHLFSDKKPKEGTLKYKRDLIAKLTKLLYFGRRGETVAGWCFNEDNSLSGIYTVFLRNLDRLGEFEEPFDPFHIAKNLGEAWEEFDKIAADPSSPASASTASSVESFEQLSPNAQCILRSVRKIMKKEVEKGVRDLSQQLDFAETEADRRNDQQISEHQATRDKTAKLEATVTSGLGNLQQGTQLLAQTLMPYLDKIGQTVGIDLNDGALAEALDAEPDKQPASPPSNDGWRNASKVDFLVAETEPVPARLDETGTWVYGAVVLYNGWCTFRKNSGGEKRLRAKDLQVRK